MGSVERRGAARSMRLRAAQRINEQGVFEAALRGGARAGDDLLRVWIVPNQGDETRLGLVISKRHGDAVRRNRLKRLLREAFRQVRTELPRGLDVLCGPQVGGRPTVAGLRAALLRLVPLAAKRLRN